MRSSEGHGSGYRRCTWPGLILATALASLWAMLSGGTGGSPNVETSAIQLDALGAQNATTTALGLARSTTAAKLEQMLDGSPLLGPCFHGEPLLPQLPAQACRASTCLWSQHAWAFVKLEDQGRDSDGDSGNGPPSNSSACLAAAGGQLPVMQGQPPRLSFVFIVHDDSQVAARALLELFLTAGEVESAEYVVIDVGAAASSPARPAVQVGQAAGGGSRALRGNLFPQGSSGLQSDVALCLR
jgi:hypothetical protein